MKCGLIGAAAILVLLAISLEHVHAVTADGCPDGYDFVAADRLCYKRPTPASANYFDADIACAKDGAVLPTTQSYSYNGITYDTWLFTSGASDSNCRFEHSLQLFLYDCDALSPYMCIRILPASDPCDPDPCLNNGICQSDGDAVTCDCQGFYTGPLCGEVMYKDARICDDPLVSTLDGATIAIRFPGTYLLTNFSGLSDGTCGFKITVEVQLIVGHAHVTSVMLLYDYRPFLFAQHAIDIDGWMGESIDITAPKDGFTIYRDFGMTITWHGVCLVFKCGTCDFILTWCPAGIRSCAFLSIKKAYIIDEATNYLIGDLRGIFGNGNDEEDDDYRTSSGEYVRDNSNRNQLIASSWLKNEKSNDGGERDAGGNTGANNWGNKEGNIP